MKKILFIVNVDKFFISHRLPVAIEAIKQGYEVHIATKITDQLNFLEMKGLIVHPLNIHRSGIRSVVFEFFKILFLLHKIAPEIVHLVTIKPVIFGGIAVRLLGGISVVSAISGLGFIFIDKKFKSIVLKKIVLYLYRIALNCKNQTIIFQNDSDKRLLISYAKVCHEKTILIPGSGVDLSKYKAPLLAKKDLPVVMFASRFLVDKGVREFIHAAEIVNGNGLSAKFILVGDVDLSNPSSIQKSELKKWKENSAVEVWGYSNNMEVILAFATIVSLPSYREGYPKILIEAAACGKAIVTTDTPGCRDAIENNVTGLLVPIKDSLLLAKSINILLNDREKCQKMGENGRKRAEKLFDIKIIVNSHMEIYSNLLKHT